MRNKGAVIFLTIVVTLLCVYYLSFTFKSRGVQQQAIEYVTDTLSALAKNIESAFATALLTEQEQQEYFFEHNLEGLLRGDITSRYRAYAIGRQWGWLSVDEIRSRENMNELADDMGKIYLEPLNMKPRGEDLDEGEEDRGTAPPPASAVLLGLDGQPITMNGSR